MSRRPSPDRSTPHVAIGPFSRPLDVHTIPESGSLDLTISASPDECAAVAAESGLDAVGALAATFHIERRAGGRVTVGGQVEATITQTCVVSLEPFETRVERPVDLTFAPVATPMAEPMQAQSRSRRREADERGAPARESPPARPVVVPGNDDQPDPPDPIVDGRIDLGAVTLEFLMLSLDLYPRKPGVHFTDVVIGDKDEAEPSPFAALARFKDRS